MRWRTAPLMPSTLALLENNGKGDLLYGTHQSAKEEVLQPQSMNLSEALVEYQVPHDLWLSLKLASVVVCRLNMRQCCREEDLYHYLRHTLVALVSRKPLSSAVSHSLI